MLTALTAALLVAPVVPPLATAGIAAVAESDVAECAASGPDGDPPARTHEPAGATAAAGADPGAKAKGPPPGMCVDPAAKAQVLAQRKHRLTRDRLFVKALRHELTLTGGYYVSDLFDSTFTVGGAYTFFMSENFGSELSVSWSRLRTTTADNLEESNNFDLDLENKSDIIRVFGTLLWSPLYGKFRLIAGSIWRYDLYLAIGPGVVVDPVSYGAAGNFGVGARVFVHQAVALRFDIRDYLYSQELLSQDFVVNDLAFTLGVSLFLPLRN